MNNQSSNSVDHSSENESSLLLEESNRKITAISTYYKPMYLRTKASRADHASQPGAADDGRKFDELLTNVTGREQRMTSSAQAMPQPALALSAENLTPSSAFNAPVPHTDVSSESGPKMRYTGSLDELNSSSNTQNSSSASQLTHELHRLLFGNKSAQIQKQTSSLVDHSTLKYLLRKQRKAYKKMLENERTKREALEEFMIKVNSPGNGKRINGYFAQNLRDPKPRRNCLSNEIISSDEPCSLNDSASTKTSSNDSPKFRPIGSDHSSSSSVRRRERRQWDTKRRSSSLSAPEEPNLGTYPAALSVNDEINFKYYPPEGAECAKSADRRREFSAVEHKCARRKLFNARTSAKRTDVNDGPPDFASNALVDLERPGSSRLEKLNKFKKLNKIEKLNKVDKSNKIEQLHKNGGESFDGMIADLNLTKCPKLTNGNLDFQTIDKPTFFNNRHLNSSVESSLTSTTRSSCSNGSFSTQLTQLSKNSGSIHRLSPLTNGFNNSTTVRGPLPKISREADRARSAGAISYFLPLSAESNKENEEEAVDKQRKKDALLQRCEERMQKINDTNDVRQMLAQKSRDLAAQVLIGQLSLKEAGAAFESLPDPPRAFPMKEIFSASKRKFEMLPEVQQRREKLIREFELCTNRIRAKLFTQKQLRRSLSRKSQSR